MARSYPELMGLQVEAERLVRAGESRAEVSRRLGVHPQTLAQWALQGGWRKKDIDMERQAEVTTRTLMAIRKGNRQADEQQAARAALEGFMRQAVELLGAGDERSMAKLRGMLEQQAGTGPQKRYLPKVEVSPDPKMGHWKSLSAGLHEPREPMLDEDGNEWTPERQNAINRREAARSRRRSRRED
jgi:hypothetical protein